MENNIGFIGVGAMGYPMAMNVRKKLSKENTMYIYDVDQSACQRFKEEFESSSGAIQVASSPKDIAEKARTIVSILPSGAIVRDVYLNSETGIAAANSSESSNGSAARLYVECSTIDIETTRDVGEKLRELQMGHYVDAPVSARGGVPAAGRGDLSFMLGARKPQMSSEVFCEADAASPSNADMPSGTSNRLQEIISWMGDVSKVYHCGALGSGLAAKLANNYLSCTLLLANAEAMAMGIKLGLDRNLLFDVIRNSTGKNWMLENVCPAPGVVPHAPSSNNYKLGFKAQMLSKDVGLAVDAARSVGLEPVVGDAALDVFNLLGKEERFRDKDGSIVYKFIGGPD